MSLLKSAIAADLHANTGTSGLSAGVWAFMVHPGFSVLCVHRIALWLKAKKQNRFADLVWRWNVARSSCHFHLTAEIAPGVILPHPAAIIVGARSRLAAGVTLYQGVTLGRDPKTDAYPTLEEGVVVFPNSVIAGGVTIGARTTIGALSYVSKDLPADCVAAGAPAKILRTREEA